MNIFITGATGLIGSSLVSRLVELKHNVTALSRYPEESRPKLPSSVNLVATLDHYSSFDEFDAVINLAGEPIFDHRWNTQQKQKLVQSRVNLTQKLTALINQSQQPPHTFLSGSASGFYGDHGESEITEQTCHGNGFAAQLCQQWEQAALSAKTRVCLLRTGIVLTGQGGALAKMLPLYRLGLGGKLGNGAQYWGWIALQDMVAAILFLLQQPQCRGPFNFVSPFPVRNAEFNRTLGLLLKRPYFATVPAWGLKWVLGERVGLLLESQRLIPEKLLNAGFTFRYPQLSQALSGILKP
ncbi:TIGR01777 family oxidoreductase [[Pasteurella] aerogenes]